MFLKYIFKIDFLYYYLNLTQQLVKVILLRCQNDATALH